MRPLWPYDFKGPQLSTCIPPLPQAALRSAFSRFRRPSRPARQLRRATAAGGSEALRTAIRWSRFGARTIAGSNSALTRAAESTCSRGPELRAPGEQARLRLRRYAVLGLSSMSSPEECRHRCPSVRSTFFTASREEGRVGWSTHGVLSSTIIPLTAVLTPCRPRRPYLYGLRRAPSLGWRPSLLHLPPSQNRPSSMNGAPNASTICARPVVSALGVTFPPLPRIVDSRCQWASCNADGSEKNRIFSWFQSMST